MMIEKVSNPLDEQETIINIAPAQIREKVFVYTSTTNMLIKLWKLKDEHPDEVEVVTDDKYGTEFSVPRSWISIKPKRQYTEEQKRIMAERLKNYRETTGK